jgi:hypothetical protein
MRNIIKKIGTLIGVSRTLNFIEGNNVRLTVENNSNTKEVDITISSSAIKTVTGLSLLGSGDIYPTSSYAVKFITAETVISTNAYTDITGASVTLAAGTWIIYANIISRNINVAVLVHGAITDSSNVVIAEASQGGASSGSATVGQFVNLNITGVVTPTTTTTYKLRAARGNTTITGSFTVMDGAGVGTTNNISDNSDKGTSIIALRIA